MNLRGWILPVAVTTAGLLAVTSAAQPSAGPSVRRSVTAVEPVVVELFTAQGCSGCPDANRVVETLSARPGVIALTYPVDYWDYLGWADTFAKPEFTRRQQSYGQALHLRAVSTPQVIIDGRRAASAAREAELTLAVDEEVARRDYPPEIEFRVDGARVGVGSGAVPPGGADVMAVTYVAGPQVVQVGGGDNRGKVVRHVNVVRRIIRLGDWTGRPALFDLPTQAQAADESVVVLIQGRTDRRILAAATPN